MEFWSGVTYQPGGKSGAITGENWMVTPGTILPYN